MSKSDLRHPEEGSFLQLPGWRTAAPARSGQVHAHLEACWQCRAELEDLQATVNDCVRYRKQVLGACLPAPPRAWGGLDFAGVDAELERAVVFVRLAAGFRRGNVRLRWALSGALALALAWIGYAAVARNAQSGSGRTPAKGGGGGAVAQRRASSSVCGSPVRSGPITRIGRRARPFDAGRRRKPKSRACSRPRTTIGTIR